MCFSHPHMQQILNTHTVRQSWSVHCPVLSSYCDVTLIHTTDRVSFHAHGWAMQSSQIVVPYWQVVCPSIPFGTRRRKLSHRFIDIHDFILCYHSKYMLLPIINVVKYERKTVHSLTTKNWHSSGNTNNMLLSTLLLNICSTRKQRLRKTCKSPS